MDRSDLYRWCSVPADDLVGHADLRVPFRQADDSKSMSYLMARELADLIVSAEGTFRAIIPCGPSGWYRPFAELVNSERVSLAHVEVFHMDECLDWEGRELPVRTPTRSAA